MPRVSSVEIDDKTNTPILIRTYGEFWSPDAVDWTKPKRLFGKHRADSRRPDINVSASCNE